MKSFGWLAVVALGLPSAFGFSLLGPMTSSRVGTLGDSWQIEAIGYNLNGRDIGGPRNLGEEYRWNTPVIYYAVDQNFTDFFGSNGVLAVEKGLAELNKIGSLSAYSADLSELPLETMRVNYRAQALQLYDVKSFVTAFTLEELGLTEATRYTWTLRTRDCPACPVCTYGVIKRSFDPVTWEPSSYVNGVLYTYLIDEVCQGRTPLAFTRTFPVDPLAVEHYPAADLIGTLIQPGNYTTGLTRDDVGGLRYLYRTNNVNFEAMSRDSTLFATNVAAGPQLLLTSNLTTFAYQALTNNAAALQAIYPFLGIVASTNIYTNIWITNITAYYTNSPREPVGTPPHLEFITNLTLTVQTWYHHIFNNVVTFDLVTNAQNPNGVWTVVPLPDIVFHTNLVPVTVQTTTVTNYPYQPVGTPPVTNTTSVTFLTNIIAGEFFVLPTNACDISLIALQATLLTINTNSLISATNGAGSTTNGNIIQSFTQDALYYFTNHAFTYYPVDCVGTNIMLRQGMDRFTFVRANFDSLVGRFFQPITNVYYLVDVTNSVAVRHKFQRIITQPDFLYTAVDMAQTIVDRTSTEGGAFNDANANARLAGPGNIQPGKTVTFNKVGPLLINSYSPFFIQDGLSEMAATTNFIWGSYDGSTNDPVVYPNGTSIANLEAQLLFQIITAVLPDGKVGTAYAPTQLQAEGGVLPYNSWNWYNGWPMLPPGLSLSPSGTITGIPTEAGTYGFTVSVTGADNRTIIRSLSINISP